MKRFESLEQVEVCICVPKRKHQLNAIHSESMDQYWLDKKPSSMDLRLWENIIYQSRMYYL